MRSLNDSIELWVIVGRSGVGAASACWAVAADCAAMLLSISRVLCC